MWVTGATESEFIGLFVCITDVGVAGAFWEGLGLSLSLATTTAVGCAVCILVGFCVFVYIGCCMSTDFCVVSSRASSKNEPRK